MCVRESTYEAARDLCTELGARLCTVGELERGEGEPAACGYDSSVVWSWVTPEAGSVAECNATESLGVAGGAIEWFKFSPITGNRLYEVRLIAKAAAEDDAGVSAATLASDIFDEYGERVLTSAPPELHARRNAVMLRWSTSEAGPGPFYVRATATARHSIAVAAPMPYELTVGDGQRSTGLGTTSEVLPIESGETAVVLLPFRFNYYGISYDRVWASTAGWVSFEQQSSGTFADVGIVHSAVVVCGASFEAGATVTVAESDTELTIRWQGSMFSSESERSDVSVTLQINNSLVIEWNEIDLPPQGSLASNLAIWLLSGSGRSEPLGDITQISDKSGHGTAATVALGVGASVRVAPIGASRYFNIENAVTGVAATRDLARGRAAVQSSVGSGGAPSRAVDGKIDGNFGRGNTCTHSANDDDAPWWQVDLGSSHEIAAVHIFHRTDCCQDLLVGASVIISATSDFAAADHIVCETLNEAGAQPEVAQCNASTGRYVTVSTGLGQAATRNAVALCEVEVFGTTDVTEGQIKLVGGTSDHEGRLEIFHNGLYGTVCDDIVQASGNINSDTAREALAAVVCRQLGYSLGGEEYDATGGDGQIWVDGAKPWVHYAVNKQHQSGGCVGTEQNLTQCPRISFEMHGGDCHHDEDVGIRCFTPATVRHYLATTVVHEVDAPSFCLRVVTGSNGAQFSNAQGTIDVFVDGAKISAPPKGSWGVYSTGEIVVDSCDFTAGSIIEVHGPTNNAWGGSVTVSTDGNKTVRPMTCATCAGRTQSTAYLDVDRDGNPSDLGEFNTGCLAGARCELVDRVSVAASQWSSVSCNADICVVQRPIANESEGLAFDTGFFVAVSAEPAGHTFEQAREFCRSKYTDLASIHNIPEMRTAAEVCGRLAEGNNQSTPCYIGLHAGSEGYWQWSDSTNTVWVEEQSLDRGSGSWVGLAHQSEWHSQDMSEPAGAFICEDRARPGLDLNGDARAVLPSFTLGGPAVALSLWARLGGFNAGLAIFSSYESADCGSTPACKNAVDGRPNSNGWIGIGIETGRDLFIAGVEFESLDRGFFVALSYRWALLTLSFVERAVHVYINGAVVGIGTLVADLPRMLRTENSIGGSLTAEPLPAHSRFAAADIRIYDRSLSNKEAAALYADPSGQCCVSSMLIDAFGVGAIDLSLQVTAAVTAGRPSAVTIHPVMEAAAASNETDIKYCSQVQVPAATREIDICSDESELEDYNGVVRDMIGRYVRSAHCAVRLSGYRGGVYRLTFTEFSTELDADFLAVYDGASDAAPLLGRFSGSSLPNSLTSTSNVMYLLFTSDEKIQAPGFSAKFSMTGQPVEYLKPSDVATSLRIGETVDGLPPSKLNAKCLAGVLLSVQCCADNENECANARVVGLALGGKQLRGSLPPQLGTLRALNSLKLHDNFLTGTFPRSLRKLHWLRELQLSHNQFTMQNRDSLSDILGGMRFLKTLDLGMSNEKADLTKSVITPAPPLACRVGEPCDFTVETRTAYGLRLGFGGLLINLHKDTPECALHDLPASSEFGHCRPHRSVSVGQVTFEPANNCSSATSESSCHSDRRCRWVPVVADDSQAADDGSCFKPCTDQMDGTYRCSFPWTTEQGEMGFLLSSNGQEFDPERVFENPTTGVPATVSTYGSLSAYVAPIECPFKNSFPRPDGSACICGEATVLHLSGHVPFLVFLCLSSPMTTCNQMLHITEGSLLVATRASTATAGRSRRKAAHAATCAYRARTPPPARAVPSARPETSRIC
jgi:hypothetical protein